MAEHSTACTGGSVEPPSTEPLSKQKFCNASVLRRFYCHREFDPVTSVWHLSKDINQDIDICLSEMIGLVQMY